MFTRTNSFYGKGSRALLSLSTLSPTLVLIGVKGIGEDVTLVTETVFCWTLSIVGVLGSILIPWIMVSRVKNTASNKTLEAQTVSEATDHMLVYGLAVILPLWAGETTDNQSLIATVLAFCLVWFLVASSNLHHANLWFRLFGYRFYVATSENGTTSFLILSRTLKEGTHTNLHCRIIDSRMLLHLD